MTEREQQVLELLKREPMMPQQELADRLQISRSAAAGHIMNLIRKGEIQGKGYIIAPKQYAAVVGGANMDLCGVADGNLTGGDSNPGKLRCSAGGVSRNIADNLARLGDEVQFVGALGDDDWGQQLKQSCLDAGIKIEHCLTVSGANSSSYLSIHDQAGELQLALNDMALLERLDGNQLSLRDGVFRRANVLVIDANLSDSALDYLFNCHNDMAIMVDPVSSIKAPKLKPYLKHIHTLKPNKLEAELLSGITIRSNDDLPAVAKKLHQQGVQRLLISLGSQGAYASDGVNQRFIGASATCVNNVTGAGDALMAGLVHGQLNCWSWQRSVDFALAAARLALAAENTINSTMSESAVLRQVELGHLEEQPC